MKISLQFEPYMNCVRNLSKSVNCNFLLNKYKYLLFFVANGNYYTIFALNNTSHASRKISAPGLVFDFYTVCKAW